MNNMISWQMLSASEPFKKIEKDFPKLEKDEVLIKVAGCGVCHTDLGFYYNGVKTKSSLPLTLGHEISGVVIQAGNDVLNWLNKAVIIPAVISCGVCDLCIKGLGNICSNQKMLGNDINGGFSSHVVVPANQICEVSVDDNYKPIGKVDITLPELSVIADALTTPYQSIIDSKLSPSHVAIFVGVGGVGGFGAQIAKSIGSYVIAVDIDQKKLDKIKGYVDKTFNANNFNFKELRKEIFSFVKNNGKKLTEWRIFETSGTISGQKLAFSLLTFGGFLSVVGFTMETLNLRLSNLMAYHATAKGNWGCLTSYYSSVLNLVLSGKVKIKPFVEIFPLFEINSVFRKIHDGKSIKRAILIP